MNEQLSVVSWNYLSNPGFDCPHYTNIFDYQPQSPQTPHKDFIFHPTVHIMRYQSRIARLV